MPASDYYPIREFPGVSLVIMPRPRAGDWLEDEIGSWRQSGLGAVLSLLEPAEVSELKLDAEPRFCASQGIEFFSFPIADRGVPRSAAAFDTFLAPLVDRVRNGVSVGVHCRAGIGRAGLAAACILVRLGISYPQVFPSISRARGVEVPDTEQQVAWVKKFATLSKAS